MKRFWGAVCLCLATLIPSVRAAASFGGVVGVYTNDVATAAWTVTLSNSVPAGSRLIALMGWESGSQTLLSTSDNKANTWTVHHQRPNNSVHNIATASALITTGLSPGDTFTMTLSSSGSASRGVTLIRADGLAASGQPEATIITNHFATNIFDVVTVSAGAFIVGHVQAQQIASGGGATQVLYTNTTAFTMLPGMTNMSFGYVPGSTVGLRHYMATKVASVAGTNAMGGYYSESFPTPHDESYLESVVAFTASPDFYVDFAAGSDSNPGTSTSLPFKHCPGDTNATASAASAVLSPGAHVYFKGGVTYTGDIAIKQSGTAANPIVYDGTGATWGTGRALIDCANTYYHAFSCISAAKNYITIKGFKITRAKNANSRQNQTINRGGVDITGVNYGGDGDIYSQGGIQANNVSTWYLDDLRIYEFENCYDRAKLNAENDGDPLTDINCAIEKAGISFVGTAADCTVTNCFIWATGHECIKLAGSARLLVTDCDFGGTLAAGATSTNMGWFAVGILIASGATGQPVDTLTVRRVTAHDGWQYQGDESQQRSHSGDWFHMFGDNDGIMEANADVHDILFDRVYCYNNHQFAFNNGTSTYFLESDVYNVEWRNCLFINGYSGGIEARDSSNLVVNASTFVSYNDQPLLFKTSTHVPNKALKTRNCVFMTQSANSANVAMGTSGSGYDGELVDSDYNVYYTSAHNNRIEWHGTNYTSLATWRSQTGMDAHSIFADPKLVSVPTGSGWASASGGDYHPDASLSSPLIAAGVDQSGTFTIDFEGNTRTAPWVIGALLQTGGGGGGGGGGGPTYVLRPGLGRRGGRR